MKTSLWIVIALVSGLVGFLVGYSASSTTGSRSRLAVHGGGEATEPAVPGKPAAGPAAAKPAVSKPAAGGYSTGGY